MTRAVYRKKGFRIGNQHFRTYAEAAAAKNVSIGHVWGKVIEGRASEIGKHPRCGVKYAKKRLAR